LISKSRNPDPCFVMTIPGVTVDIRTALPRIQAVLLAVGW
jgi:hypothetical protein